VVNAVSVPRYPIEGMGNTEKPSSKTPTQSQADPRAELWVYDKREMQIGDLDNSSVVVLCP
jgi:hypothetical protein